MSAMRFSGLAVFAVLFSAAPVVAHHGTAGSYDENKTVTVKGVVKEFRWRNPHSALFLTGKDASGNEVAYAIEMGSPNALVKIGFTRTTLKAGDEVILQMHPSLTNSFNGVALAPRTITVNGKELTFEGPPEEEYKR